LANAAVPSDVYLSGHGNDEGFYLGLSDAVPSSTDRYSVLTPQALNDTIATMAAEHRYRRILVAAEACQGGAFGTPVSAPGALLLSASNPVEDSLSINYDSSQETWLADHYSYELWTAAAQAPTTSLDQLYRRLYLAVDGSHVSAYGPQFGNPSAVSLGEFLTP
jgi:glycosylphosphatidylinositol transamidase (GPIT) subunit GPI8